MFGFVRGRAVVVVLVVAGLLAGGAQGARVRRGNVSFSQDGNRLIVRASNGAIIEYDRLSIEAGQIMRPFVRGNCRELLRKKMRDGSQ